MSTAVSQMLLCAICAAFGVLAAIPFALNKRKNRLLFIIFDFFNTLTAALALFTVLYYKNGGKFSLAALLFFLSFLIISKKALSLALKKYKGF